ncbi:11286_t:CDS:2 [Acaulospora colombiana]|uniref:11286_t:CDS:1 n=1 Tax=Acaulospora colombiana TaxID=27376 RepID=A0ACA9L3H0_9GLOM|nr:11286_t:CDS:2 [Acaulospora colombiana]
MRVEEDRRILPAFAAGVAGVAYWHANDNNIAFADSSVRPSEEMTEEPNSKVQIPNHLTLYNGRRARLVGLGIRTVSLLRMKVYVIGMYISEDDIGVLKNWKGYDKEKFLSTDDDSLAYELLGQPVDIAIRIEPVRNTNGQHLKDGFTRTLTNRMREGHLDEDEAEQALEALKEFKSKFPRISIKAGTSLILTKQRDGNLRMEYEGKDFGVIKSPWLAKNLFMGYLTANNPISKEQQQKIKSPPSSNNNNNTTTPRKSGGNLNLLRRMKGDGSTSATSNRQMDEKDKLITFLMLPGIHGF